MSYHLYYEPDKLKVFEEDLVSLQGKSLQTFKTVSTGSLLCNQCVVGRVILSSTILLENCKYILNTSVQAEWIIFNKGTIFTQTSVNGSYESFDGKQQVIGGTQDFLQAKGVVIDFPSKSKKLRHVDICLENESKYSKIKECQKKPTCCCCPQQLSHSFY